jgi:hypothetical protein
LLVYIEYISRRPGVSLEAFHEVAGRGQTGWAGEYADDRLVLWPQRPERKLWWRNFRTPQPISVRLAGRMHDGIARVAVPDDPEWPEARSLYASRWPRVSARLAGPLVVISLDA